jgi:hypothetical protein
LSVIRSKNLARLASSMLESEIKRLMTYRR